MDPDSRLAVLESRIDRKDKDDVQRDERLAAVEQKLAAQTVELVLLKQTVATWAAIGGVLAGIGAQLVGAFLRRAIHLP